MKQKYFVLLPDGIGLRNFAYTSFYKQIDKSKEDIVFWNATPFNLSEMGYPELKAPHAKLHKLTDVYKNVRKNIELYLNIKRTNDKVYDSYRFPRSYKTINSTIKNILTSILSGLYKSEAGLSKIQKKIISLEKSTPYFKQCVKVLKKENPSVVFCTNQRPSIAIAPIEAAKFLGIPTVCFIFSWDNLPKATIVVESDYYFVWSKHMKKELLFYYPNIKEEQIIITGTTQFEGHFNPDIILSREEFFSTNNLDAQKKYICFSGDDVTTSPNDPYYLRDTAQAVRLLNKKGYNLGIIFRRCPVDFSDRYNFVLEEFKDIIVPLAPKWKKSGGMWDTIMPTKEDTQLLVNTAKHTELVINVGSSMVFDYVCHDKPCAFINYDSEERNHPTWNIDHIYKYIHFKSMPNKKSVLWLNSKSDILRIIEMGLTENVLDTVENAKQWFDVIVDNPKEASSLVYHELNNIAIKK